MNSSKGDASENFRRTTKTIPRMVAGKRIHQSTVSGAAIKVRNDVICQGNGASTRVARPMGKKASAPDGVEMSASAENPEFALVAMPERKPFTQRRSNT